MAPKNPDDAAELLRLFTALPKRYMDQELMVEFDNNGHFSSVPEETCDALKLPIGESVGNYTLTVEPGGQHHNIYAHSELAERLLQVPAGTVVNAKVRTIFAAGFETTALSERHTSWRGLQIVDLVKNDT